MKQNTQNNEKGIFLLLILLCHNKREAKTLKLFFSKWCLHAGGTCAGGKVAANGLLEARGSQREGQGPSNI